jgi:hypothetical protein
MENQTTPAKTDVEMDSSDDDRIIPPPPPVAQHTFFPDPLAPDPIIYHIREVTPGMIDEEKKEIYSVRGFPTKDLSDQIAGTPPDKDFSNAKPTNQVAANTFLAYVEPYVRPLTEEDMAFLRERVGVSFGFASRHTDGNRAIAQPPSCPYLVASVTTPRSGPKRTAPSPLTPATISFLQTKPVAALSKLATKLFRQTKCHKAHLLAVSSPSSVSNTGLHLAKPQMGLVAI